MNASDVPARPELSGALVSGLRSLPRGPHRLPREAVLASQRGRILEAVLAVSVARGFRATTVADVVAAARVSRKAFYDYFDSIEACFAAALDALTPVIVERVAEHVAAARPRGWSDTLSAWIEAYLTTLEAEPVFARALIFESLSAGPPSLENRRWTTSGFIVMIERVVASIAQDRPFARQVERTDVEFFLGGVRELILNRVLADSGPPRLLDLAPHIKRIAVVLLGLADEFDSAGG